MTEQLTTSNNTERKMKCLCLCGEDTTNVTYPDPEGLYGFVNQVHKDMWENRTYRERRIDGGVIYTQEEVDARLAAAKRRNMERSYGRR